MDVRGISADIGFSHAVLLPGIAHAAQGLKVIQRGLAPPGNRVDVIALKEVGAAAFPAGVAVPLEHSLSQLLGNVAAATLAVPARPCGFGCPLALHFSLRPLDSFHGYGDGLCWRTGGGHLAD